MKVEKKKFDELLARALSTKPAPRENIKSKGKRAPKTPILSKP
jgi:hypothetical protein